MFVAPGRAPKFGYSLTRDAAAQVARNWWVLLFNGALLIVAGFLIFSIDWTVSSLATFIGALFILEGLMLALTTGIDATVNRINVVGGLLSIAAGIAIIIWPAPGVIAVAIFLGVWLVVVGAITISESFAVRKLIPNWWLLLITGLLEVALGVLALADPGVGLAALVTVGGIWAVAVGVSRIVMSFELKRLPHDVDSAFAQSDNGSTAKSGQAEALRTAAAAS
jgi:uncharacterized membrane protein HdeD (DUF308 family)